MPYTPGYVKGGGFTGTVPPKRDPIVEMLVGCIVLFIIGIFLFFYNTYIISVQATIVASAMPKHYRATYTSGGQTYTVTLPSDTNIIGTRTIYASFLNRGNAKLNSTMVAYIIGVLLMVLSLSVFLGYFGYSYYKSKQPERTVVFG